MLSADSLTIARGGRRLAADISFTVAAGEALIVVGRNGTGKSTLLRVIAGHLAPAYGKVRWTGGERTEDGEDEGVSVGARAHYLGHADSMKSALTPHENLAFWAAMLAIPGAAPALSPSAALERFDLAHIGDLPVSYLSAGQKRRVALARLLVAARPLWLLDEPTAALDSGAQRRLVEVMCAHLDGGGAIIAATHAPLGLGGARELSLGGTA